MTSSSSNPSPPISSKVTLAHLVDLAAQMRRDGQIDEQVLRRRDRSIGKDLAHLHGDHRKQVLTWLDRVAGAGGCDGKRAAELQRLVMTVMVVVGLLVGVATAAALLHYDGRHPVNVTYAIGVFVGLQALLLLIFVIVALPRDVLRRLGPIASIHAALGLFSPGRLQPLIARWLPAEHRTNLADLLGRAAGHQATYHRVQKWAVLLWSQAFAVAFNVGALLASAALIALQDIAFVWSTTLDVDPQRFHHLTQVLALPWRDLLPRAVPSLELIKTTKYFRLSEGQFADWKSPEALGQWWRFLIASLVAYGLLPRLASLAWARWRFNRALGHGLLATAGVARLVDRLSSPRIETQARTTETLPPQRGGDRPHDQTSSPIKGACRLLNWSGVPIEDAAAIQLVRRHLRAQADQVCHVGGQCSPDDDQRAISALGQSKQDGSIVIMVKSWEPPMLEFMDFLQDLRAQVGEHCPVIIAVMAFAADGELVHPEPQHLSTWKHAVIRAGNPSLSIETLGAR